MVGFPPEHAFWQEQRDQLHVPRIAPITDLVTSLRQQTAQEVPYVAPIYGGTEARLLMVLTSPGRATHPGPGGTGFLCIENSDRAAATVKNLLSEAGISPREMTPWNACPWFTGGPSPTAAELEAGVEPWAQLIGLLPDVRVIMLLGGAAQDGWRRVLRRHPGVVADHAKVIRTYSPGPQAFRHPDPAVRDERRRHLRSAFYQAAAGIKN
jgi:uracil-DNA glycosylase